MLPCSRQTLYDEVNIHPPSSLKDQDYPSEVYELPHYQISNHRTTKSTMQKVCNFAIVNRDNKIEISEKALELLGAYSKFQVLFCGVYGGRKSGKSTFIDNLLKTDLENEKGFISQGKADSLPTLKINIQPLQVGQNKKMFFIQYSKSFQSSQIGQAYQKLLDVLIFFSNSIVLMVNKDEALLTMTKHIKISAKRLKYYLKNINYWPQNLYIINTYSSISKDIGSIDSFFRRVSLILWIKGESKSLSNFLKDASSTNDVKSFRSINNNFHIAQKIILKLEQEENLLKPQRQLNIEGIFQSVYQQLCSEYLLYHYDLYDSSLQQYFLDEKPYRVDYLIDSFEKCRTIIINHFKENHINKDSNEEEAQKLEDYIDQRERLIVEVNKKKSQFQLKHNLEEKVVIKHKMPKLEEVSESVNSFRGLNQRYEHAGVQQYAQALHEIIKNIEKGHLKLKRKEEDLLSCKMKQLEEEIQTSKESLKQIKQKNSGSNIKKSDLQSLLKKDQQLKDNTLKLKKQIELQKKTHKQLFNKKISSQQKADKLLETVRQFEEKVRENSKIKKDIEKQYDFNPEIQRLNRQLERLERKINGQGSKLESMLYSQIQPSKISAPGKEKVFQPNQTK